MSDISMDDYSYLTARFYDAATDDGLWAEAIEALKRRMNLSQVALGWFGERGANLLHGDCSPYFKEMFFALGKDNVILAASMRAPAGTVFQDQSLLPKDEFRQSVVFNEWFAPQDDHSAVVGKLSVDPRGNSMLTLQRGGRQPTFSEGDMAFVDRLLPVLIHALTIRQRLGLAQLRRQGEANDAAAIGFAVVDSSGLIVQHNETAARQFGEGNGLGARQGRLVTEQPSELAALIARAAARIGTTPAGGETLITTGDDRHPAYAVSVGPAADGPMLGLPLERGAMIFIQTLKPGPAPGFAARMQSLFALTPKEAALAAALAAGMTLQEAADERFVSMATARSQLGQIFHKTNTSQQSQLVSLLLRVLAVTH